MSNTVLSEDVLKYFTVKRDYEPKIAESLRYSISREERKSILKQIEQGQISAEEAEKRLTEIVAL